MRCGGLSPSFGTFFSSFAPCSPLFANGMQEGGEKGCSEVTLEKVKGETEGGGRKE